MKNLASARSLTGTIYRKIIYPIINNLIIIIAKAIISIERGGFRLKKMSGLFKRKELKHKSF